MQRIRITGGLGGGRRGPALLVGAEQLTCGVAPRRVLSRGFLLCHSGPGALCGARRGRCCQAREPSGGRPRTPSTWAEDTHLEHDFIDGSSVGFKVEVFIVVIA